MALFTRRRDDERIASAVAEQVTKALEQFQPLPRTEPDVAYGPLVPLVPQPIDPRLASGRTEPRRSEYPVGYNLPGASSLLPPFQVLRQLADRCDVARRCIDVRKAQIVSLTWDIRIAGSAVEREMAATGERSPGKAAQSLRGRLASKIADLQEFWSCPDRANGYDWAAWLSMMLEETFVVDALAVWPHLNRGGGMHSFEILAGDTIKPLLDHRGARPVAPQPAYQQILYGFPRGEFSASSDPANEFNTDGLLYKVRSARPWTPYGFSNVEQAIPSIDLYLKRTEWLRTEYTEGTVPELFLKADAVMTAQQIADYEQVLNDQLAGQPGERRRIKIIPKGYQEFQPQSSDRRYSSETDDHLIKLICMCFDMQPTELGFAPKSGLGGKGFTEGMESATYRKAIRPTVIHVASVINELSRRWLGQPPELEFAFIGYEIEDQLQMEQTYDSMVRGGRTTINESRAQKGLPLFDFPEADTPFVVVGSGLTYLPGSLTVAGAADEGDSGQGGPTVGDPVLPPPAAAIAPAAPSAPASAGPQVYANRKAELATFAKFARGKQGKAWRPFTFQHIAGSWPARLNDAGEAGDFDLVKALVADAGKAPVSTLSKRRKAARGVAAKYSDRARAVFAAAVTPRRDKAVDPDDELAVDDADLADLADLFGDVRSDAWSAGVDTVGADLNSSDRLSLLAAGAAAVAAKYLAGYLRSNTPDDYADTAVMTDAEQAATAGMTDGWVSLGYTQKTYVADGGCGMCTDADGETVGVDDEFKFGDPPLHPNCGCTVEPTDAGDAGKVLALDSPTIPAVAALVKAMPAIGDQAHVDILWPRWTADVPTPDDPGWETAKPKMVSLDDLWASTKRLRRDSLLWHVQHPGQSEDTKADQDLLFPLVAKIDGELVIVDGHHRLAALKLLDESKAAAYVMKVDTEETQ